jgi:hypothetical protein
MFSNIMGISGLTRPVSSGCVLFLVYSFIRHFHYNIPASNGGHHWVVLQLYKREEIRQRPLLYIKTQLYNWALPSYGHSCWLKHVVNAMNM